MFPIQGLFLLCSQCPKDILRIHYNPEQDKVLNESLIRHEVVIITSHLHQ